MEEFIEQVDLEDGVNNYDELYEEGDEDEEEEEEEEDEEEEEE